MSSRRLLASALTLLLLAGCADTTGGSATNQPSDAASSEPGTEPSSTDPSRDARRDDTPLIPPSDRPTKPRSPEPRSASLTISGTVTAGVEPDCLLLKAGGVDYLLLLPPNAPNTAAGATVTVVGQPRPGMMTTCQQGTPFMVTEVRPG